MKSSKNMGAVDPGDGLNVMQRRFVAEYVIDLNATQAAIRAGYSAQTANQQSSRLLAHVKIKAAIEAALEAKRNRALVSQDEVVRELARIAFSDVWHYQQGEGRALEVIQGAPDGASRAVASVKHKTRTIPQEGAEPIVHHEVEYRLWDKNTALANLAKHLGMFIERHEVTGKDGAPLYKVYKGIDDDAV